MLRRVSKVLMFMVPLLAWPASGMAAITLGDSYLRTEAGDFIDGPGEVQALDSVPGLPFAFTRLVASGASQSTSVYTFSQSGPGAIFHVDFDQVRDGDGPPGGVGRGDYAYSAGEMFFSISEEMTYQISGTFNLQSAPNGMSLFVDLVSLPTQREVYQSWQSGAGVPNQQFQVGGQAGSNYSILSGNPSGVLAPGDYVVGYQYTTRAAVGDAGGSATGWFDFRIVPEPGTLALIGVSGLALLRRQS